MAQAGKGNSIAYAFIERAGIPVKCYDLECCCQVATRQMYHLSAIPSPQAQRHHYRINGLSQVETVARLCRRGKDNAKN